MSTQEVIVSTHIYAYKYMLYIFCTLITLVKLKVCSSYICLTELSYLLNLTIPSSDPDSDVQLNYLSLRLTQGYYLFWLQAIENGD